MRCIPRCAGRSIIAAGFIAATIGPSGVSTMRAVAQDALHAVAPALPTDHMLQVGEELEYSVSYSFFSIGTIRFKITERTEHRNRVVYKAHTIIDSNPSLSWLADVHIRFYSMMDEDVFTYQWSGDDSASSGVEFRMMDFDYPMKKMYYVRGVRPNGKPVETFERETVAVSGQAQDGLSLFYYARRHVRDKRVEEIPTFIDKKEESTRINFLAKIESQEIDAVEYPVETVFFNGHAGFVGVFGLTGGFEGWFSNDDARIPVTARLKVILGSIKVELTGWKRPGWSPPRASE
ncbi:MAG: hypothetical protein A2X67_04470 [Ignavibacteria bacterium GWA2_55_11]|nr:MAG: hypothetical protein A2X67_04470 [Ignavibacteria bacterium GWA2_55_11]OGU43585.1 MAG: hypothetical protein A2X68_06160 [Ignavibacteria bacterium GWC2_56_12]